ncbi:CopG family transcriptional regulator [Hyphomonas oceanitis]|uniref:CopG family transcriptional regulator n=1 Tax=Hyphomonas oceanitis TaxID=81033 RepID=UPI003001B774|tara:strand:- start:2450 stop:2920 length:471 start_codon:yes stop_codon:yes gene_type:complete
MKPRIQPYISADNLVRLRAMARRPGLSESKIVDRALAALFAGDTDDQRDAAITRRLDRLTRQFGRLERHHLILGETVSTFVRYFLTVTPPVPADQLDAARAKGDLRFDLFVHQVAEALRSGDRILQNAVEDFTASPSDFVSEAELDRLGERRGIDA